MTVWDDLVGQAPVIARLQQAVAGDMTHAWLFTGPPGSGRSNAAIAFAAALQCEQGGCGVCHSCHNVTIGSHPDVRVTRTEKLSIGVDDVRELVRTSALAPVGRRYQVMVIEDADRLTESAANALLKAVEEPNPRTVWLLCAPTVEDVLPTIRSRTRLVVLATPSTEDVAAFLQWTAEPKLAVRHQYGVVVLIFLLFATVLAYMSYRNIWADAKRKVAPKGALDPENQKKTKSAKAKAGIAG